jgi:hypothetical protein
MYWARSFKGFDRLLYGKWIHITQVINYVGVNMRLSEVFVNELISSRQIAFIIEFIPLWYQVESCWDPEL